MGCLVLAALAAVWVARAVRPPRAARAGVPDRGDPRHQRGPRHRPPAGRAGSDPQPGGLRRPDPPPGNGPLAQGRGVRGAPGRLPSWPCCSFSRRAASSRTCWSCPRASRSGTSPGRSRPRASRRRRTSSAPPPARTWPGASGSSPIRSRGTSSPTPTRSPRASAWRRSSGGWSSASGSEAGTADVVARARQRGMSLHQLVTLASIVEKEAALAAERPIIAARVPQPAPARHAAPGRSDRLLRPGQGRTAAHARGSPGRPPVQHLQEPRPAAGADRQPGPGRHRRGPRAGQRALPLLRGHRRPGASLLDDSGGAQPGGSAVPAVPARARS